MEKTKVMIVDDHEQMRTLLAEIVEQDDSLTVAATAADGAEAYRLICGMEPDVVLLDLIMPEMDGLTLLERLRADSGDRKCPKVIMISAVSEESMVREAFRLGVSYYMIKPFLPEVLLGRIKALMLPEEEKPGQSRKIFPCEDLRSPERREMETEIAQMLHRIGVPAHIRGYAYLKEAVAMVLEDVELLRSVTGKLYPALAEKFDTTGSRVERSIRHAIESAWDRGESDCKEELFGYTIHKAKGKPTNSEFIALIADKLKMDFGW